MIWELNSGRDDGGSTRKVDEWITLNEKTGGVQRKKEEHG